MPKDLLSVIADLESPPTFKYFDGQRWTFSISGKTTEIISPVDGTIIGKIPYVSHAEIDQVVAKSRAAQKSWKDVPLVKRANYLHVAADWMRDHDADLVGYLMRDIGKPYQEAIEEIRRSADMMDYFAHESSQLKRHEVSGDEFPGKDQARKALVERVPLGVVLAISPFNEPLKLAITKIAPALVTGNSVIFKPSTQGSIIGLLLTEILRRAGVPDGVLVTVTGEGSDIGEYLAKHLGIDLVTFTGTTHIGKVLIERIGMIPSLFECGGNNPAIVLPDADLSSCATEIVRSAFSYSGQQCTSIKYILGLSSTIEELIPKSLQRVQELVKSGDLYDVKTTFGPLVSLAAAEEVERRIMMAKTDGARVIYGGNRVGKYIEPTLLDNVRSSMEIIQSETFGPVLSFVRVDTMQQAIQLINDSMYGLQASIFTQNENSAMDMSKQINVGTVQVNSSPQRGPDHFPYLGVKGSGVGVQGIRYTLKNMTRIKSVVFK